MKYQSFPRIAVLVAPLLLLAACSDDPVKPQPEPEFTTRTIYSSEYLNNRFFRLDLPEVEAHGRVQGEWIEPQSIKVFRYVGLGSPQPGDVLNMAAYVDSTGFQDWAAIDMTDPFFTGSRWQEVRDFDVLRDERTGELNAIDLTQSQGDQDLLVCTYEIVDREGFLVARVGDNPALGPPTTEIPGMDDPFFKMKLLKARTNRPDPHVFRYVLRNIYGLGSTNIDPSGFDLRIAENNVGSGFSVVNEQGFDYLRIFGLDNMASDGSPGADGESDWQDRTLFNLEYGLLIFPLDFPEPFASSPVQYEENVQSEGWAWDEASYLANNLTPEIYDIVVFPAEYYQYQTFQIMVTTRECPP